MARNLPTKAGFPVSQLGRVSEVPDADWSTGMNPGASGGSPAGIATNVPNPGGGWTLLDQAGAAREPQQSQAIGLPLTNVLLVDGADVNDRAYFVEATGVVAPGGTIEAGVINRSDKTLADGDQIWAEFTVA